MLNPKPTIWISIDFVSIAMDLKMLLVNEIFTINQ